MTYYIASDHAGVATKSFTIQILKGHGFDVIDLGPQTSDRVDYPDFAVKLCHSVINNKGSLGILICGSGIGMSIAANKVEGIRAALCQEAYTARMAREHNDANVLCFGARIVGDGMIENIIEAWAKGKFEGGRHADRVAKIECGYGCR